MKKIVFLFGLLFVSWTFSEGICSEQQIQKGFSEYNGRCRSSGLSLQVKSEYNREKNENEIIFTIENNSSAHITNILIDNGEVLDVNLFKEIGNKDAVLDPGEKIEVRQSDWLGSSITGDSSFSVTIWKADDDMITLTENVFRESKVQCENIELSTRDEERKKMIHVVCSPENDYELNMIRTAGLGGGGAVYDAQKSDNGVFDFQIHTGEYEISCARLGEFVANADNKCLKKIEIPSGYESEYQLSLLQLFKESDERRFKYFTWMGVIVFFIGIMFFFARSRKHFFLTIIGIVVAEILLHRNNIATPSIYGFSPESLGYVFISSLFLFRLSFKSFKTEILISILPGIIYIALTLIPFPDCLNGSSVFHGSTQSCECVGLMKKQFYRMSAAGTSNDASQCIGYAQSSCYKMDLGTGTTQACN